jgi:hypothetical protein
MENIKIICHSCNTVSIGINNCDNCDLDLRDIRILYITALSGYNRSIKYLEHNHIIKSWEIIKEQLYICPFLVDLLLLGYLLAVENGDYKYASKILNQLKPFFSEDEYQLKLNNIQHHIDQYNQIINNELNNKDLLFDNFSLYHLIVLFKISKPANKKHILDQIDKRDPNNSLFLVSNIKTKLEKLKISYLGIIVFFSFITFFLFFNDKSNSKKDKNQLNIKVNNLEKVNSDLLRFIETIQNKDYVESIEILRANQNSHFLPKNISFIVEGLPNAYYRLYLQKKKAIDRHRRIEEFLNFFPNYYHYTAPLLEEIIKYYGSKSNVQKAHRYAILLKNHVENNPGNSIYLNSYVQSILKEYKN